MTFADPKALCGFLFCSSLVYDEEGLKQQQGDHSTDNPSSTLSPQNTQKEKSTKSEKGADDMDGDKFNIKIPAALEEHYEVKDKCIAGQQPKNTEATNRLLTDDESDSDSDSDESNTHIRIHGAGNGDMNTNTNTNTSQNNTTSTCTSPYVPSFEDLSLIRDEKTVLNAVYGEDFSSFEGAWGYPVFCVKVRPPDIEPEKIGSSLSLHVKLGKDYPFVIPSIELKDLKGLSLTEQKTLMKEIEALCKELALTGSIMVCELVQLCEDFLLSHNVDTNVSAWEQTKERKQKEKNAALVKEKELNSFTNILVAEDGHGHSRSNPLVPLMASESSSSGNDNFDDFDGVHNTDGYPLTRYSRYKTEFREISPLGKGGFGTVFKVNCSLDGRAYAMKKVLVKSCVAQCTRKLEKKLREVNILSRLDHVNIVRYYTAWLEVEDDDDDTTVNDNGSPLSIRSNELLSRKVPCSILPDDPTSGASSNQCARVQNAQENPMGWDTFFNDTLQFDASQLPSTDTQSQFRQFSLERQISSSSPRAEDKVDELSLRQTWSKNAGGEWNIKQKRILYIQMELCGKTLLDYIHSRERNVNIPTVLRMFGQIVNGVKYIHERGFIHRDLKPSNCFMDDSYTRIKIGDFGLSRSSEDRYSRGNNEDGMVMRSVTAQNRGDLGYNQDNTVGVGTISYASPEQMRGSDYDSSSDVYSLGIILFELCHPMQTGMERFRAFEGIRRKPPLEFPTEWQRRVATPFPSIHCLLERMLSHTAKNRPTAAEVAYHVKSLPTNFP